MRLWGQTDVSESAIALSIAVQNEMKKKELYRHYATSGKIADSRTDEVNFFNLPNHSGRTMPWCSLSL
jgi:hypothetical protein